MIIKFLPQKLTAQTYKKKPLLRIESVNKSYSEICSHWNLSFTHPGTKLLLGVPLPPLSRFPKWWCRYLLSAAACSACWLLSCSSFRVLSALFSSSTAFSLLNLSTEIILYWLYIFVCTDLATLSAPASLPGPWPSPSLYCPGSPVLLYLSSVSSVLFVLSYLGLTLSLSLLTCPPCPALSES